LAYDPLRDFAPVTLMAILPSLLTVHPSLSVRTVQDLVAMAKARPGQLTYASTGNGTSPHMLMEMLKFMAGINPIPPPDHGPAPAVVGQISGPNQTPFHNAGNPRP